MLCVCVCVKFFLFVTDFNAIAYADMRYIHAAIYVMKAFNLATDDTITSLRFCKINNDIRVHMCDSYIVRVMCCVHDFFISFSILYSRYTTYIVPFIFDNDQHSIGHLLLLLVECIKTNV